MIEYNSIVFEYSFFVKQELPEERTVEFRKIFALAPDKRVEYLRKIYLDSPVGRGEKRPFYYSGDRWMTLSFLDGWQRYAGQPTTVLRRAYSEAYVLDCSKPLIDPREMLVGRPDHEPYTPQEQQRFDQLYAAFTSSPTISKRGRADHLTLDYEKLLRVGVDGVLKEIDERCGKLPPDDSEHFDDNLAKREFYEGCRAELEALLRYTERYASRAREMAKELPEYAETLEEIAATLDRVPRYPARTFREALQSVHFFTFNLAGLYQAGRPDKYLLPYYEADRKAGILSLETAQFLVDQYCMLMNTYVPSTAAVSVMIGGSYGDGKPVANEVTALFLNSVSHTHMAEPNLCLALTDAEKSPLLDHALRLLANGETHPALYNDKAIVRSLIEHGVSEKLAHDYSNTACVEISVNGKTNAWTTCPWVNLAQPLLTVLEKKKYDNCEEIFQAYTEEVQALLLRENNLMGQLQMERARNGAMPLRVSCLVEDCLARGKSLAQGGARYNPVFPAFVGMANVADSLSAIDYVVYKEKRASLENFLVILKNDFEGEEALRQWIVNRTPHYGNDCPEADRWMQRLMKMLEDFCATLPTFRRSQVVPGAFSFSQHAVLGRKTGATPDGRKAGTALADSCGAVQGRDKLGPTASLLSATCWKEEAFIGGVALNMRFTKDMILSRDGENIRSLLATFLERGGVQIQINTADVEALRKAQENPEQYADLLVRVGGYSDYFVRLPRELQNDIMARTMHAQ